MTICFSMLYKKIRSLANCCRAILKLDILNPWVRHGRHIRCPMSVWLWSPTRTIVLGDYVSFGPGSSIQCDVIIGSKVLIARNVAFVARDAHVSNVVGCTIWDSPRGDTSQTVVEDDVWIGHGALIVSGVRIGRGSIVAAGAIVTHDVPQYAVVAGVPAKPVKMRFTPDEIRRHERLVRSSIPNQSSLA